MAWREVGLRRIKEYLEAVQGRYLKGNRIPSASSGQASKDYVQPFRSDNSRVFDKMLLLVEARFRRLDAPKRMKQVFLGVQFRDGIELRQEAQGSRFIGVVQQIDA